MANKLLPTKDGRIITENGIYYSARAIASLNLKGLPKSRPGAYKKAINEGWEFISAAGKGAKDGVQYFKIPDRYSTASGKSYETGTRAAIYSNIAEPESTYASNYIAPYTDTPTTTKNSQLLAIKLEMNADEWHQHIGPNGHQHIKIITVHGDSMKPTLCDGDQVLVDTSCQRFTDNAIYIFQQGGALRPKRVKLRLDGSVEVKSDNEVDGFKPEIYSSTEAENFKPVGKVIPFKFGKFSL